MGKGSMRRPGSEAAYRNGWDRIFGTAKENLAVGTCKDGLRVDSPRTCLSCAHRLYDFEVQTWVCVRKLGCVLWRGYHVCSGYEPRQPFGNSEQLKRGETLKKGGV